MINEFIVVMAVIIIVIFMINIKKKEVVINIIINELLVVKNIKNTNLNWSCYNMVIIMAIIVITNIGEIMDVINDVKEYNSDIVNHKTTDFNYYNEFVFHLHLNTYFINNSFIMMIIKYYIKISVNYMFNIIANSVITIAVIMQNTIIFDCFKITIVNIYIDFTAYAYIAIVITEAIS